MSLLAWFPLNNSITNLGDATVTMSTLNNYSTLNNTGKTAPYCYGNASFSNGGLVSSEQILLGQNQSMFCWVKFTSLNSDSSLGASLGGQHRYPSNTGMGLTIKYITSTTGYLSVNTGNGSARTFNTYCGSTLLSANTWYHVGYTYDGSTIRLYLNGNLDGSHAFTGMSTPKDYLMIGCWSFANTTGNGVYTNYKLNGYIQDFRAYDHVLSIKEIKNLARGLVVHYDFENLYIPVNYIQTNGTQYINTGVIGPAIWKYDIEYTAAYVNTRQLMGHGGSGGEYWGITDGKWGKASWSTSGVAVSGRNIYQVNNFSGTDGGNCYLNGTYIYNNGYDSRSESAQAQIFAIGGSFCAYCKLYSCKVYNTSMVLIRDYIPAVRATDGVAGLYDKVNDVFYTNAGTGSFSYGYTLASGYIQDCSGNSLQGKITNSLTEVAEPVIGTRGVGFSGNASIDCNAIPITSNMTFAAWLQFTGSGSYHIIDCRAVSGETGIQPMYGGTGYGLQCYSSNGGSYTWSAATCGFTTNTWYHVVVAITSSNATLYINGVSKGTQSGSFGYNAGSRLMRVGTRCSGANWFVGNMADVVVYATTLTADDVKDLYENKGLIDKAGNFYCYGQKSGDEFSLSKKGVSTLIDFAEGGSQALIAGKYTKYNYIDNVNPAAGATSQHNRCDITDITYNYIEARLSVTGSGSSGGIMLSGRGAWWRSWQGSGTGTVTMTPNTLTENTWTNVTWNTGSTYTGLWTSGWSDGTNYWTPQHLRYEYIKTYLDKTMTGYFIPVKKSDGTLGMFNLVNGKFYGNSGSGSFEVGQSIGKLNGIGCNNFYKDGGAAVARYDLANKRLCGSYYIPSQTGLNDIELEYIMDNGEWSYAYLGEGDNDMAINYPYSWTAEAASGYTVSPSSGSGIFIGGTLTIQPTVTSTSQQIYIYAGTGVSSVYLSTSSTATSGSPSGTTYSNGQTVYGFARTSNNYYYSGGTALSTIGYYRIGSKTIPASSTSFGTITASALTKPTITGRKMSKGGKYQGTWTVNNPNAFKVICHYKIGSTGTYSTMEIDANSSDIFFTGWGTWPVGGYTGYAYFTYSNGRTDEVSTSIS